jgi:transcriptional regulator with XRE-family HTH domain
MSFSSTSIGLKELLRDPSRRHEFFKSITQDEIASQIRELRKRRDMTQSVFANKSGMKQSAVSRIEQAEYSSWTLSTLFKVAFALNARWRVTLQPIEEAVKEYDDLEKKPQPLIPSGRSALDDFRSPGPQRFGDMPAPPAPTPEQKPDLPSMRAQ